MTNTGGEVFDEVLNAPSSSSLTTDKFAVLSDFKARVNANHAKWQEVLGSLQQYEKNAFSSPTPYFGSPWMYPRSRQWQLPDYARVRKLRCRDIPITKTGHGAECRTDHLPFF
ncbi:unnamed protein product [Dibothriocephalus latus]|uniref:Uncharacterized protein n=1 Tax=Dibothriocephalus latus TaxID=60516 RepID=A0A3P7LMT1_DIBLA|nr:unnamed protein product [Dibothriocephalus latus]